MGALGYTIFCENGHIVEEIPHHCSYVQNPHVCQYCGSNKLVTLTEWPDEDYGSFPIPYNPIRYDWIEVNNDSFKGEQKIAVYDVSKVKNWHVYTKDEVHTCLDCGENFVLTGGEIDFFNRKGLKLPKRCKKCREDNKNPEKVKKISTE